MNEEKDSKPSESEKDDKLTKEEKRIQAQNKAGRGIGGSKKGSISKKA